MRARARLAIATTLVVVASLVLGSSPALAGAKRHKELPADCQPGALGHFGYSPNATDGTVSVVDLDNNKVIDTFGKFRFPWNVLISENGRYLYVDDSPLREAYDSYVAVVDVCSRKVVKRINALGFEFGTTSPDEKTIWVSNISTVGTIQVDANTAKTTKTFATVPLTQGALSADNKTLWCISLPGLVTTFDMKTTLPNGPPIVVGAAPAQFAITPNGKTLATGNLEGSVTFIDTATHQVTDVVQTGMTSYPSFAVFTPDNKQLWAGSYSGDVYVIDAKTKKIVKTIKAGGWVGGVAFSNDGTKAYVTTTPESSIVPQFGVLYLVPMLLDVWKPGGLIRVYDTTTYQRDADIKVGNVPIALAIPGAS